MTPVLILIFGLHPVAAVGTDLLYAAATKTIATVVHGLGGTIDWKIVARLASGSLPSTALTVWILTHSISAEVRRGGSFRSCLGRRSWRRPSRSYCAPG